ncbi:class I SAM-dependent methyltransferase [Desulfosporosinus youngiae]|uniref:Methylase involved in ubiquinone/menaquinone biosynthesis n=1 Tax=Desulfosporosinus youngiae DSM 17734 TaxID=768710 RepID=H5XXA5_9FIRM|nr:class I SAM-dependent methyltransferase [Desulfosporosinus youngiae]EHQ91111.1 methylase involved in ubiquinone/menaquinone biosynthesis [Desulfosporosinus youngiae DSM 17734]
MHIQKRIENYWQTANERYDETIQRELKGVQKEVWLRLLRESRPPGEKLEVLDIGTGPGFFPLLLSEMGHQVTAIDCTESMLATARENAEGAGFDVSFHLMDAHKLAFEDNSFDMILTRNVTWLMYDPPAAYREWHRVLKPGGRLLIFDANYYLWTQDSQWQEEFERDTEEAVKLGFKKFEASNVEESNRIGQDLFFSKIRRPQWDVPVLFNLGFGKIYVEGDLSELISDEISKVRYRTMPPFMIRAEKTEVNYLYGLKSQDF